MSTTAHTPNTRAPNVRFRNARRADAHEIARLFEIASDGVATYVWSLLADEYPGMPVIEIGARRYAREGFEFSYENCLIAEVDDGFGPETIGFMHSFPVPEAANDNVPAPSDKPDPVLCPYSELECGGSLYIAGLALHPEWRGRGIGSRLLSLARQRALAMGLHKVSLVAFEQNEGAVRLYRRHGFTVTKSRGMVPHPMIHVTGGQALLMVRGAA